MESIMIILYILGYIIGAIFTLKVSIKKFGEFKKSESDNLSIYIIIIIWPIMLFAYVVDYFWNLLLNKDITNFINKLK